MSVRIAMIATPATANSRRALLAVTPNPTSPKAQAEFGNGSITTGSIPSRFAAQRVRFASAYRVAAVQYRTARWYAFVPASSLNFPSKAVLYESVASNPKIVRKVERAETDGILIHFYLACGHLITEHKSDYPYRLPSAVECWACEEERKEP
jgi:hypothetical protein